MISIKEILTVLYLELSGTNLHILIELSKGIFRLRGKITGLNISRYTNNGGSYRNIQRFFSKKYNWTKMRLQHFVGDGAYGNNNWILMLEKHDLQLISKLHYNSGLYLEYTGTYSGKGRPKKYGKKIDIDNINSSFLIKTIYDKNKNYIAYVYQTKVLHKKFRDKLNVVIIVRVNRKTGKKKNIILFSNDLELSAQKIIDIYSLRFQIEFNFRDAKQFFGLSDFKNIKKEQLCNAINLSLSMILLLKYRTYFKNKKLSINDLKALFTADMYIAKILKIGNKNTMAIFYSDDDLKEILAIGLINNKSRA